MEPQSGYPNRPPPRPPPRLPPSSAPPLNTNRSLNDTTNKYLIRGNCKDRRIPSPEGYSEKFVELDESDVEALFDISDRLGEFASLLL
jgi:hypothetical protein